MANLRGGVTNIPTYRAWRSAYDRCYKPTSLSEMDNYRGRGIKMQESWHRDPQAFHEYVSKLPGYEQRKELNLSLDRIDNDGHYEEGNLRWATKSQQAFNQRPRVKRLQK